MSDGCNPLVVVSSDEVLALLRAKADEAGFADRQLLAVQIDVRNPFAGGTTRHHEIPQIAAIVSKVADRTAPEGPKWIIAPDDVEWEMDWGDKPTRTGRVGKEMVFEKDKALAHLLLNEVVHLNSYWWKTKDLGGAKDGGIATVPKPDATWTEEEASMISVSVICNDVFAWGCADAEGLPYRDIETLYRMWRKDPDWGPAVWCMVKRNQMPQKPVEERIRKAGIWDLDALKLGANTQDDECRATLAAMIATGRLPGAAGGVPKNDTTDTEKGDIT